MVARLALPLLLLGSCRSPLYGPEAAFVDASRATHEVLAPRWKGYVAADLELDALTRDQLLKLVDDWELAIQAATEALGPVR